ncbi:hypothetical protein M0812_14707 [Anaeramoeba flamelloides]|uniref:Uncharacterized protein n=1 Tax=Anaeramoeba flamelloides TaxID=1746091 RepID=A0AAV7ZC38_9EUKA|nr:hypothetical protein M0812_14707 [Anaeramoeba flamelloides]
MSSDDEERNNHLTSVIDTLIREENKEKSNNSHFRNNKKRYRVRIRRRGSERGRERRERGRGRRPYSRTPNTKYLARRSDRDNSRRTRDYNRFVTIANNNIVIRKGSRTRSRTPRLARPSTRKKLVIKSFGRGKRRVDEERTSIRGQRTSTRGQRRGNEERYSSKRSSSHLFRKHDEKKKSDTNGRGPILFEGKSYGRKESGRGRGRGLVRGRIFARGRGRGRGFRRSFGRGRGRGINNSRQGNRSLFMEGKKFN